MIAFDTTFSSDGEDPITDSLDALALEIEAYECVRQHALSPLERSQIEAMEAAFDDLFSDDDDDEITEDVLCKSATTHVQEKPTLSLRLQSVSGDHAA